MQRSVTTTYLEMTDRAQLRPARPASLDFQVLRAEIPCPELNRFLYTAVGADWWWHTRLSWDYAQWLAYLDRPELETWVAYAGGTRLVISNSSVKTQTTSRLPISVSCRALSGRDSAAPFSPQRSRGRGTSEPRGSGSTPAHSTIRRRSGTTRLVGSRYSGRTRNSRTFPTIPSSHGLEHASGAESGDG